MNGSKIHHSICYFCLLRLATEMNKVEFQSPDKFLLYVPTWIVRAAYSKRRGRLLQEVSFLDSAWSAENAIPVRKAAKAAYDLVMTARCLGKSPFCSLGIRVWRRV
jgi:hypothetical protein